MNDSTVVALTEAGWSPSRAVDPTDALSALRQAGYESWASLVDFLTAFGGLVVRFVRNDREDTIWFDPQRAIAATFKSWVDEYVTRAGTELAPAGFAHHDHLLLMMGADGRWFGGYDDVFGEIGSDDWDMLDALIEDRALRWAG